ncbi:glycosyltransferase family 4 protein [Candidatus Daviesbacteria bacterium]|nr:glycosyltransferase family 4 protein [Candidatus Daviesbacteria bacterium]
MRILVLSWKDTKHPLSGGAEQVMHQHMKSWAQAGHQVYLFSSNFYQAKRSEKIEHVQIIRQGSQVLGVHLAGILYYLKHRNQFDLVVDQFHGLPFFTPLYVKKPKLAIIQETAREVWFLNFLPWPLNWIVGLIGFLTEPLIFKLYRNVTFMTASESTYNDLIKLGISPKKIIIVPHGLKGINRQLNLKRPKTPTISYLGTLSKDKGIEDALDCFEILNKTGNFNYWVIGKSETASYTKRIEKMAQKLGLINKVKFWGYVSDKMKYKLLSKSHLLINPSVREGWGLVNLEANLVGTPVVAYNSPGLVDSVKDNVTGIICQKNTPQQLAEKVTEILNNKARYSKLQKGAYLWGKKHSSWNKSQKSSLKLIERVAYAR